MTPKPTNFWSCHFSRSGLGLWKLGLPGTLCLLSRILVSVLLLAEVQHLSPIFSITNLMGHIFVDCFSDLQAGFECTRHKQENMFPQHQCRWSDSQFVLQQKQWFLDHCISICFWQLQLLEVQNHSYWVCFLLYTIFDCIHIIKFGLLYSSPSPELLELFLRFLDFETCV